MSTATLSDLLRTPKDVIKLTRDGAVTVVRRDGPDLVLMRAADLAAQREGLTLASQVMRASLAAKGDMVSALKSLWAWTSLLSDAELAQFASDMDANVWAAVELDRHDSLLLEFHRWRETADAYAAGLPRGNGCYQESSANRPVVERP
ncbi:MAG: hypothetical protein LBI99_02875 [Propionibacteriaceae bacterium]|jgi:hypothetical protein|nr:hypothetical protein [Propionibacteriaceae bacterium]